MRRLLGPSRLSTFGVLRPTSWDHLGDEDLRLPGRARARIMARRRARARLSRCSEQGPVPNAGTAMPAVTEALPSIS